MGDWFATALFWRPRVALLVNQGTFVPLFMEMAPAATLRERVREPIETVLRHHGLDQQFLSAERGAVEEVRLAPTDERRLSALMNELTVQAEIRHEEGMDDLVELSLDLGSRHPRRSEPFRNV